MPPAAVNRALTSAKAGLRPSAPAITPQRARTRSAAGRTKPAACRGHATRTALPAFVALPEAAASRRMERRVPVRRHRGAPPAAVACAPLRENARLGAVPAPRCVQRHAEAQSHGLQRAARSQALDSAGRKAVRPLSGLHRHRRMHGACGERRRRSRQDSPVDLARRAAASTRPLVTSRTAACTSPSIARSNGMNAIDSRIAACAAPTA